ncbi:FAD-dependent oxidoreductase [Dactylosporangium darangshiense]|uniref:NAD(P)-binding domain-containing protein n=1 Tax=Dactylosporangium darangshiense TaxID=579108 RepID=A0ABP8DVX2_9ACTN
MARVHGGVLPAVDVVVIGAGQAGLSAAYWLRRRGLSFVVLDAGDRPGGAWARRSPSLGVESLHRIFDLPGMAFRPPASGAAADVVPAYFRDYELAFDLPVLRPAPVRAVTRIDDGLRVHTAAGQWDARSVINATGTWRAPYIPYYPGIADFAGRRLHYADYRGPEEFAGQRVLVVGGGNSAVHVLAELPGAYWVTRREPVFHDGEFSEDYGRQVVAQVAERVEAGLPPRSVVSVTGLGYTALAREALRRGTLVRHPMFDRLVPGGAMWGERFEPFDAVIWATGFRADLAHLAPLHLREPGGGIRMAGTRVVREPRLHLVGYGPSASTVGANRAGRDAVRSLAAVS